MIFDREFGLALLKKSDKYLRVWIFITSNMKNGEYEGSRLELSTMNRVNLSTIDTILSFGEQCKKYERKVCSRGKLVIGKYEEVKKEPKQPEQESPEQLELKEKQKKLDDYIVRYFPNVSKIKKQLTWDEYQKIKKAYGMDLMKTVLTSMENYKGLSSKYNSVYLTLNNWCKSRKEKNV